MYAHQLFRWGTLFVVACAVMMATGCQTTGLNSAAAKSRRAVGAIRRVHCIYDQDPWLNVDVHGDRDPEGIQYRVFLDTGDGIGVLRDGTLHIDMYMIVRKGTRKVDRVKISDWHYSTSRFHTIAQPGLLGEGYHVYIVWARKDTAGKEVELITTYESPAGAQVRSGTKRFRVPDYPA